jgi:[acyl-carrier-protein] S-malonyltransferase
MEDSIRSMAAMGVTPLWRSARQGLSGFVKKTVPEVPVAAVETAADVEALPQTLEGLVKKEDA